YLLFSGTAGDITNLYNDNGFIPKGWLEKDESGNFHGLLAALVIIMFSFGGLELVGITAAEATNPDKNIPKATNQVIYRILIFYIGSLIILFSLMPWRNITADTSPFVSVFASLEHLKFDAFGTTFYF